MRPSVRPFLPIGVHLLSAVDIGATSPLKLALNTAQYGRTFQDRSHIIQLSSRITEGVPLDKNIYNLNIRGKRGNIVQVLLARVLCYGKLKTITHL